MPHSGKRNLLNWAAETAGCSLAGASPLKPVQRRSSFLTMRDLTPSRVVSKPVPQLSCLAGAMSTVEPSRCGGTGTSSAVGFNVGPPGAIFNIFQLVGPVGLFRSTALQSATHPFIPSSRQNCMYMDRYHVILYSIPGHTCGDSPSQ